MPRSSRRVESDPAALMRALDEGKTVVIDFSATWCGPCKAYSPKFSRLEREMRRAMPDGAFAFFNIDIDRHQALAREAGVMSVPTTVAWRMGKSLFGKPKRKEVLRFSGDKPWNDLVRTFTETLAKGA